MNLNLPLPPHLEQFVRKQLASGRFETEEDVLRAALRLLEDQSLSQPMPAPRFNQSSDTIRLSPARRSPRGLLADIPSAIGPDEIKDTRSEMWAGLAGGEA